MIDKIAASVVLYNPDECLIDNIKSCINQVDEVFLIDNSEKDLSTSLKEYFRTENKISYIRLNKNFGIAEALNIALNKADEKGFEFLLTLDQDSRVTENMVLQLYEVISKDKKIGLVTPVHFDPLQHSKKVENRIDDIMYTMTSGNLLRISAAKLVGGFDSKLFIDHVDHEFCLKLKSFGYQIKKVNNALLYHKLGSSQVKRFLWINFYPSNHNPIRIYYRTRNRLYVKSKYQKLFPNYSKEDCRHFMRELLDILFCEKQRFQKIKMMISAFIDYKKGKFGPFGQSES